AGGGRVCPGDQERRPERGPAVRVWHGPAGHRAEREGAGAIRGGPQDRSQERGGDGRQGLRVLRAGQRPGGVPASDAGVRTCPDESAAVRRDGGLLPGPQEAVRTASVDGALLFLFVGCPPCGKRIPHRPGDPGDARGPPHAGRRRAAAGPGRGRRAAVSEGDQVGREARGRHVGAVVAGPGQAGQIRRVENLAAAGDQVERQDVLVLGADVLAVPAGRGRPGGGVGGAQVAGAGPQPVGGLPVSRRCLQRQGARQGRHRRLRKVPVARPQPAGRLRQPGLGVRADGGPGIGPAQLRGLPQDGDRSRRGQEGPGPDRGAQEAGAEEIALILRLTVLWGVALLPLAFWPPFEDAFKLPQSIVIGLLGGVTAVGLLSRVRPEAAPSPLTRPHVMPVLALIAWIGLAGPHGAPIGGRALLIATIFGLGMLPAILDRQALATIPPAAFLAGVASGLYSLAQYAGIDFAGAPGAAGLRPFSTMGNPDFLAAYLVAVLPVGVAWWVRRPSVLKLAGCLVVLAALLIAQSRGAWLGILAAALVA